MSRGCALSGACGRSMRKRVNCGRGVEHEIHFPVHEDLATTARNLAEESGVYRRYLQCKFRG